MPAPANQTGDPKPRRDEKIILTAIIVLALIAGGGSWLAAAALSHKDRAHGVAPDRERTLGDFSLTDTSGKTLTRSELDGKMLAVSFLFTSCSLTCPEVSRRMAEIQRLTANDADVRLISLTVDPRSDTPPVLAKWGARFGADTNRWHLLTGSKTTLHELIARSFLATETNNPFNSMPGNFAGTERITVVDQHGRVRVYFDGLRADTPAAVVAEFDRLRKE